MNRTEVTPDGKVPYTSTSDRKGAATDSRKSASVGTNRLSVTEDRSLCREGMAVRVWYTAERHHAVPESLHGDLEDDPFWYM